MSVVMQPLLRLTAVWVIRLIPCVLLIGLAWLAVSRSYWEVDLWTGQETFVVDLPPAPAWDPPPAPHYDRFKADFPSLPAQPDTNWRIIRVQRWSWTVLDFAVWGWWACAATAVVYFLVIRRWWRDPVLFMLGCVGLGMSGAAGLCIGIWIVAGGWGPPTPLAFAIIGLVGGLIVGAVGWRFVERPVEIIKGHNYI